MKKRHVVVVSALVLLGSLIPATSGFASPDDSDSQSRRVTVTGGDVMTQKEYEADLLKIQDPEGAGQLGEANVKQTALSELAAIRDSVARGDGASTFAISPEIPQNFSRGVYWRGQETSYWCGPAAMQMALHYQGLYPSQSTLASQAGTTYSGGTTVSGLMNALNSQGNGAYWSWMWLSGWPTSSEIQAFKDSLMLGITGIYYNHVYATIGDAWMVPGGYHLNGWTGVTNDTFHYFTFRGYTNYGNNVYYMDPYASYNANIPQSSSIDAWTVVTVMGGRGYAY